MLCETGPCVNCQWEENIWTEPTVNKTQNTEGEENILPQTSVCSADEDLKASMQVYVLWFSYFGGGFSLILWLRKLSQSSLH